MSGRSCPGPPVLPPGARSRLATTSGIPFFNEPESDEKRALDALINADRLVLVGVVLPELIQSCTAKEAEATTSRRGVAILETAPAGQGAGWSDWFILLPSRPPHG